MTAVTGVGEVARLPEWVTDEFLLDEGLVAVAMAAPHREVFPGVQTRIHISNDGPRLEYTGLVAGTPHMRTAAASLTQQFAYRGGLPPGHGGVRFSAEGSDVEPLASDELKRLLRRAAGWDFVGYLALVDRSDLEPAAPAQLGVGSIATRRTRVSQYLFGVGVDDVSRLLGPGGFDALRDGVDHPIVSQQLRAAGLRPDRFDAPA